MHSFWDVLLAGLPILLALLFLIVFKVSSMRTAIICYLIADALALLPLPFQRPLGQIVHASVQGLLTSVVVIYVLVFGLFLYNVLKQGGAIDTMANRFSKVTQSQVHQALLISAALGPFLEATSGFGIGIVIAAPIYLNLGFAPKKVAILSLLTQSAVPWGALAVGTVINSELSQVPLHELGVDSALLSIPLFFFYTFVVVGVVGGWKAIGQHLPVSLFVGVMLSVTNYLANDYLSTELAAVVSGFVTAIALIGYLRLFQSKDRAAYQSEAAAASQASFPTGMTFRKAILSYAILTVFILLTHLLPALQRWLNTIAVWRLPSYQFQLELLYSPGFALLLVSVLSILVYRLTGEQVKNCLQRTLKQVYPAVISTVGFVAMSTVMQQAGMTDLLVTHVAMALGSGFLICSPLVGGMGGFMSGSNSASNAMFSQFQSSMAQQLHQSSALFATSQNVAASNLTMSSPSRVSLVAALTGSSGQEGELTRKVLQISLGALALIIICLVCVAWVF